MTHTTVDQAEWESSKSTTWVNGVKKTPIKEVCTSAVVSGGVATFSIADSEGNAILNNNVYIESLALFIQDGVNVYNWSDVTVSEDKKTITVAVNRIALSLGVIVFNVAANGKTVYLRVKGD